MGPAELEARSKHGSTAFLYACEKGSAECIVELAEAGCDTTARNSNGGTGLMHAAALSGAAAVEAVLAVGGAELDATDDKGATAFLTACHKGQVDCIRALAEAGCNRAAASQNGRTALMLAICVEPTTSATAAVKAVLNSGDLTELELEARDDNDLTAFLIACRTGNLQCMADLQVVGCDTFARSERGCGTKLRWTRVQSLLNLAKQSIWSARR